MLNASETDAVIKLDSRDAIYVPHDMAAYAAGNAVRKLHGAIFRTIALSMTLVGPEARAAGELCGSARTSSAGKKRLDVTGRLRREPNSEPFVFESVDDRWPPTRHCFPTDGVTG